MCNTIEDILKCKACNNKNQVDALLRLDKENALENSYLGSTKREKQAQRVESRRIYKAIQSIEGYEKIGKDFLKLMD